MNYTYINILLPNDKIIKIEPVFEYDSVKWIINKVKEEEQLYDYILSLSIYDDYNKDILFSKNKKLKLKTCLGDIFPNREIKPILFKLDKF